MKVEERIKTKKKWQGLLKEQVESGKSVRQFCKELGIRENQFFWWRKKLNSEKPAKEQIAPKLVNEKSFDFLPVTVVGSKVKETLDENAGRMDKNRYILAQRQHG